MRIAFAGFRHGHIFSLYGRCQQTENLTIVACAEDDETTRKSIQQKHEIQITHSSVEKMLTEGDYDIVAIGDYYTRRGSLAITALEHGAHVISDKPFCTSLDELDVIEKLALNNDLAIGCMFDLRDASFALGMKDFIDSGELGEVMGGDFRAHHPLLVDTRPSWYFEGGKHGGIFNDIAIHAFDLLPWICGLEIGDNIAGYSWATSRDGKNSFHDGGKCLFTLSNGAGVSGDVSYFTPDAFFYGMPTYWKITISGTKGQLEGGYNLPASKFYPMKSNDVKILPLKEVEPGGYLREFMSTLSATKDARNELTKRNIMAQRNCLKLQKMATSLPYAEKSNMLKFGCKQLV